jgi:hypothetical protein
MDILLWGWNYEKLRVCRFDHGLRTVEMLRRARVVDRGVVRGSVLAGNVGLGAERDWEYCRERCVERSCGDRERAGVGRRDCGAAGAGWSTHRDSGS